MRGSYPICPHKLQFPPRVAEEVQDRPAVDLIMDHENGQDIANHYVERIGDARLKRVSERVKKWLL